MSAKRARSRTKNDQRVSPDPFNHTQHTHSSKGMYRRKRECESPYSVRLCERFPTNPFTHSTDYGVCILTPAARRHTVSRRDIFELQRAPFERRLHQVHTRNIRHHGPARRSNVGRWLRPMPDWRVSGRGWTDRVWAVFHGYAKPRAHILPTMHSRHGAGATGCV